MNVHVRVQNLLDYMTEHLVTFPREVWITEEEEQELRMEHGAPGWGGSYEYIHSLGTVKLVVKQTKHTCWINIYDKGVTSHAYTAKEEADARAWDDRIACIKVEYKKGEGL